MRWIFYSLVFANFAFFGWELYKLQQPAAVKTSAVPVKTAKPIELVEESLDRAPARSEPALSVPVVNQSVVVVEDDQAAGGSIQNKLCASIGPMQSEAAANTVREQLAEKQITASVVRVVAGSYQENWVVIPPRKDRETALQVLRKMQAEGVDSYMITSAPRANAISLGVFRNVVSATQLKNSLDHLGYPVEIQFRDKEVEEFWVKLSRSFRSVSQKAVINALLEADSGINREESLCE